MLVLNGSTPMVQYTGTVHLAQARAAAIDADAAAGAAPQVAQAQLPAR